MKFACRKSSDADRHPLRERPLDVGELALDPPRELERVGARLLLDREHDARLRVHRPVAALGRRADHAHRPPGSAARARRRGRRPPSARCRRRSAPGRCRGSRTPAPGPCTRRRTRSRSSPRPPAATSLERHAGGEHPRGSASTWYCFTSPPIGITWATPGTASSRRRSVQSATVRRLLRPAAEPGEADHHDLAHDRRDRGEHRRATRPAAARSRPSGASR